MKKLVLFVAIAAMALMTGVASAAVIYDNGAPDGKMAWLSDNVPYSDPVYKDTMADNFVLTAGASTIKDIHWWGSYGSGLPQSNDFTIRIYTALLTVNLPGALVYENNIGDEVGTEYQIGELTVYAYSINVNPIVLQAGQTYWLEIVNNTGNAWYWETSNGDAGSAAGGFDSTEWENIDNELAFNLTGDQTIPTGVPEPATMMLLGLGLAGVAAARKKFRK